MRAEKVTVFCPGHISGYFKPVITGDPSTSGSLGAGVVISQGVTVTVRKADSTDIRVFKTTLDDGERLISDDSPIISDLLQNLGIKAHVETRSSLPLSSGYGLSAASLLATILAVNEMEELGFSSAEATLKAHFMEILHRTGLGDVSACQEGGWCIRTQPGPHGEITRFFLNTRISAITLSSIQTSSILSQPERMKQIDAAFPQHIPKKPEEIMSNSRRFAEMAGLISNDVRKVLTACDANGIPASMTMLGNGVFALGEDAPDLLKRFGTVFELYPAKSGPVILEKK